jgi:lipoic acid synthetase
MLVENLPDNGVGIKHKSEAKTSRIPIKIVPIEPIKKPDWIKVKLSNSPKYQEVKELLRKNNLHTVCEEASCPNISECFSKGTATFMIMGDICTRRCPFCDVGHGRPNPLDPNEPQKIADAIKLLSLHYVVITSVDRDDLRDGGAKHFIDCIELIRKQTPNTKIEILVPDFRGRLEKALNILAIKTADVLNHNLETVPRLYKQNRPGSDYQHSLKLLSDFKKLCPTITTKSGLMVGLGETDDELKEVFRDLRLHNVDMLTLGQYLQPSAHHAPVTRYMSPERFKEMENYAYSLGFKHVAAGPMVRSSYHADLQANHVMEI